MGLALLLVSPATAAYAANTYTVTTNTDDYSGTPTTVTGTASHCPANGTASGCTLRDAITAALANSGSTVKFAVTGTNTLNFVLPVISVNMTIMGPGANALTISGGYQQFSVSGGLTTATISGLTLANANNTVVGTGLLPSYAGAIYNLGATLTVDHVVFANNTTGQSTLPGEGGAILNNEGILTVNDCTFIGNSTQYAGNGGAITSIGTLTIKGSSFIANTAAAGSAIYSLSGLSIYDSTFTGNYATLDGAVTFTSGTMTVENTTFFGNLDPIGPNQGSNINDDGYPGKLVISNSIVDYQPGAAGCLTTSSPADCPVNGVNGNIVGLDSSLKLAPLGYYGGPTETMPPLPGSPAHCAGSSSAFPGTDQRGFPADLACGGLVDAGAVQTNYLTVTTATDDPTTSTTTCGATCTLRDAIRAAAYDNNGDIIFASGLSGSTITLGAALPTINATGSIDIQGPGANLLTVSGNNTYPVFNLTAGTLDLSGITVARGKTTGAGAGIDNTGGAVTLSNVLLSGNTAGTDGGAINNGGTLLASDSTFSANNASEGSAIYNTGAASLTYSTVANNSATSSGGIYNNSGATMTAVNTTFAGNSGGTAPGILNNGALMLSNALLDAAAECSGSGCPASGGGNVVGATVTPLGAYGGPTPTVLPQPGSSAICAGSVKAIPLFASADQRGFGNENPTYTGYSTTAPCVDAGSVQTNYTAVNFTGAGPFAATANVAGTTPPVVVAVTESGQNVGGVSVALSFSGNGSATGLTATTVAGAGATFSGLTVNTASASGDTLSVSLPVTGTDKLTAGPVNLTVAPASTTTALSPATATPTVGQSVLLTATVTGPGQPTGTVVFMSGSTTLCTASVGSNGVATCWYTPSTSGPITVTAQYLGDTNHTASNVSAVTLSVAPYDAAIKVTLGSTQLTWPGATSISVCISSTKATPTGTVQIDDGQTLIATLTLWSNGCASSNLSGLAVGTHTIQATYSGDKNNAGGISTPVTVNVAPAPVYLVPLCLSVDGSDDCLVGAISTAGLAPGVITYTYNGSSPVTVPLTEGIAIFTIAKPVAGVNTVTISYPQQTNYAASGPVSVPILSLPY